jgi:hypothetical protein
MQVFMTRHDDGIDLMRTSPLTIHPHLYQYLLQQHLLDLLLALVLVGLPIK